MNGRVEGAVRMPAEPNVTPMIDVLMVLLIIFMVAVLEARIADIEPAQLQVVIY